MRLPPSRPFPCPSNDAGPKTPTSLQSGHSIHTSSIFWHPTFDVPPRCLNCVPPFAHRLLQPPSTTQQPTAHGPRVHSAAHHITARIACYKVRRILASIFACCMSILERRRSDRLVILDVTPADTSSALYSYSSATVQSAPPRYTSTLNTPIRANRTSISDALDPVAPSFA